MLYIYSGYCNPKMPPTGSLVASEISTGYAMYKKILETPQKHGDQPVLLKLIEEFQFRNVFLTAFRDRYHDIAKGYTSHICKIQLQKEWTELSFIS